MKFGWTVTLSVLAHVGLFSLVALRPSSGPPSAMTYYVDLVSMPGGGDGRPAGRGAATARAKSGGTETTPANAGSKVRDLTVAKDTVESELRFPDEKNKKNTTIKPKPKPKAPEKMVTVVTRQDKKPDSAQPDGGDPSGNDPDADPMMRIGVGTGSGEGEGSGRGLGFGPGGPGGGGHNYYYAALQNKIKNAWFNTAISGGDPKRIAAIACRIHRSGEVSDVRVYQSSGNEILDDSGLRAVRRAAPFPPFPVSNPNAYIDVIFEFEGRKR